MTEIRVRMSITPWTDTTFVQAVEDAWKQVSLRADVAASSSAGARVAEELLHEAGFVGAQVIDRRTVDEVLDHVAHWQVIRDRRQS